ncbi:hypothetical protein AVEN_270323-1, partial [Araneus ventricosus]
MAKRPPVGVARKFGEEVPTQVSSSSSDRGSKTRGPSLNSPRVASNTGHYSRLIDARTSQHGNNEGYEQRGEWQQSRSPYSQQTSGQRLNLGGYEEFGQQQMGHEFGGQQQVDYEFGEV